MTTIIVRDSLLVAENDHGYQFCVGTIEGRWVGFAVGFENGQAWGVFLFSEISVAHRLGVESREEAIRMTAALAQDDESAYGGVDRWHVQEELRASPEDYRCEHCDRVCCGEECLDDVY